MYRNLITTLLASILSLTFLYSQDCYEKIGSYSGFEESDYTEISAAACAFSSIFNQPVRDRMKVYDFDFYLHQDKYEGGIEEALDSKIAEIGIDSNFYVLFARASTEKGLFSKTFVRMSMPEIAPYDFCFISSRVKYLEVKFEKKFEEKQTFIDESPANYLIAAKQILDELKIEVEDLLSCCSYARRDETCSLCGDIQEITDQILAVKPNMQYFDLDDVTAVEGSVTAISAERNTSIIKNGKVFNLTDKLVGLASAGNYTTSDIRVKSYIDIECQNILFDLSTLYIDAAAKSGGTSRELNDVFKADFISVNVETGSRIFFELDEDENKVEWDNFFLELATFADFTNISHLLSTSLMMKCLNDEPMASFNRTDSDGSFAWLKNSLNGKLGSQQNNVTQEINNIVGDNPLTLELLSSEDILDQVKIYVGNEYDNALANIGVNLSDDNSEAFVANQEKFTQCFSEEFITKTLKAYLVELIYQSQCECSGDKIFEFINTGRFNYYDVNRVSLGLDVVGNNRPQSIVFNGTKGKKKIDLSKLMLRTESIQGGNVNTTVYAIVFPTTDATESISFRFRSERERGNVLELLDSSTNFEEVEENYNTLSATLSKSEPDYYLVENYLAVSSDCLYKKFTNAERLKMLKAFIGFNSNAVDEVAILKILRTVSTDPTTLNAFLEGFESQIDIQELFDEIGNNGNRIAFAQILIELGNTLRINKNIKVHDLKHFQINGNENSFIEYEFTANKRIDIYNAEIVTQTCSGPPGSTICFEKERSYQNNIGYFELVGISVNSDIDALNIKNGVEIQFAPGLLVAFYAQKYSVQQMKDELIAFAQVTGTTALVALAGAELSLGIAAIKAGRLAFGSFRVMIAVADLASEAADKLCVAGRNSVLCDKWKKYGTYIKTSLIFVSAADLAINLRNHVKLHDEISEINVKNLVEDSNLSDDVIDFYNNNPNIRGALDSDLSIELFKQHLKKYPEQVKAWKVLNKTGLATDVNVWLPRVSKLLDEGLEFVESGANVIIKKGGNNVGEIVDDILHVKYTGHGGNVVSHSSKTTTVIGKYDPPGGVGTKQLIDSKLSKSGENAAGVNVLNDPNIPSNWTEQQIWDNVNKPWMEAAASRGDVIRAVSDPTLPANINKPNSTNLSFFGRENELLTKPISQGGLGYTYNPSIFSYVK